jgi:hypothetical protein
MEENKEIQNQQPREYREERFEFALYVNDNLICKRNFRINNFIDDSMQTLDFKEAMDGICRMIDEDLKSKSRVYTWYYYDEENPDEEFTMPLLQPWESTFKFVVTDNKKEVFTKIWDGYGYPKAIRDKVDIANKTIKIVTKDGTVYTYDKETYFKEYEGRLAPEIYVMKAMMGDKQDLLIAITRKICEVCSPRENGYQTIKDYVTDEVYRTVDENGIELNSKKYIFSLNKMKHKTMAEWGVSVAEKTKQYFNRK